MKKATAIAAESPPREHRLGVRLTEDEKALIAEAAGYRGARRMSKWARKAMLSVALAEVHKGRAAKCPPA